MKRCFLTLLLTLVFIIPLSVNAAEQVIHDWTTPASEQTANDPLTGYANKYSIKGGSAADRWNPSLYYSQSSGGASLSVNADLLNTGEEMNVVSWIEATSDQGSVSAPSKDGMRTNKTEHDHNGRDYFHDSKRVYAPNDDIYADAVTSYKAHPVAVYRDNLILPIIPIGDRIERNFSHSAWASEENSPSGLPEFNPYAVGSVEATSRASLNLPIGAITFVTPHCTGEQAHEPGPCPGHGIAPSIGSTTNQEVSPLPGLRPVNGSADPRVRPGGTHEAELVTSEPYYYVRWYIKGPGGTSSFGNACPNG